MKWGKKDDLYSKKYYTKTDDFGAANFIIDFQMDLINMNDIDISVVKGPGYDILTQNDTNDIYNFLIKLWNKTYININKYSYNIRLKRYIIIILLIYLVTIIMFIFVYFEYDLLDINLNDKHKLIVLISFSVYSLIVIIILVVLLVMYYKYINRSYNIKFLREYSNKLSIYIYELKKFYNNNGLSNLEFTLIYPMFIYKKYFKISNNDYKTFNNSMSDDDSDIPTNNNISYSEELTNIWCYLRISDGHIITGENEPIYCTTIKSIESYRDTLNDDDNVNKSLSLNLDDKTLSLMDYTPSTMNVQQQLTGFATITGGIKKSTKNNKRNNKHKSNQNSIGIMFSSLNNKSKKRNNNRYKNNDESLTENYILDEQNAL